ncbi:MAG: hypothetical protein WEB90_05370 [Gemmatimonadota bacterium]
MRKTRAARPPVRRRPGLPSAALCAAVLLGPIGASAQQRPEPQGVAGPADPTAAAAQLGPLGVSPRGAFVRALLIPGWGHAAIGSYTRGGFYFALETATAYTFVRTRARLSEARERAAFRESVVRARLAQEGITDLAVIDTRLEEDALLQGLEDLVASREGQQEDLVAWGIFLLFLTGADAYVSAHLARFPAPIEFESSASSDGRAEIGLRISVP